MRWGAGGGMCAGIMLDLPAAPLTEAAATAAAAMVVVVMAAAAEQQAAAC